MKYIISVNSKRFIGEKLVEMASENQGWSSYIVVQLLQKKTTELY